MRLTTHPRRRLTARALGLASLIGALGLCLAASPLATSNATAARGSASTAQRATSVLIPISFTVRNVNRSKVKCSTDGATYTERGHLVVPTGKSVNKGAVTLYLHGLGLGEFFWNFTHYGTATGYHFADTLAADGQTSVILDRLGYGRSEKPAGANICIGSQADIAHQEVQDLSDGHYTLGNGHKPVKYGSVVLAGHSVGGLLAQVESYSFGDAAGYIDMDWADQGDTTREKADAAQWAKACAAGGQPVVSGGPGGYAPFARGPAQVRATFFSKDANPAVVRYALTHPVNDPCGDATTISRAVTADKAHLGAVRQPVLVLFGGTDALFTKAAAQQQVTRFTSSQSATFVSVPHTSHAITLELSHDQVAKDVASWLDQHGF